MTRIQSGKYSETKVYNAVLNVKKTTKMLVPGLMETIPYRSG
jgi:hypothetical protein